MGYTRVGLDIGRTVVASYVRKFSRIRDLTSLFYVVAFFFRTEAALYHSLGREHAFVREADGVRPPIYGRYLSRLADEELQRADDLGLQGRGEMQKALRVVRLSQGEVSRREGLLSLSVI